MDATEARAKVGPAQRSLWVRLLVPLALSGGTLALFGGTYIAAAFIGFHFWHYYASVPTTLAETGRELLDMGGGEPTNFIGLLLMVLVIFPVGWYYAPQAFGWGGSTWLVLLAYPIYYLMIALAATLAALLKRRWIVVVLYVIFVLLLLVNIKGCTYVGPVDLS